MDLLTFFRKNAKKWFVYSLIYLFLHAVSMSVSAEQIYFVHTDHINTPMMVTDQDQNVVWEGVRKPFGEMEEVVADIEQPIRFPGQYYDQETGLYYNLMRDYDPVIGRYIQSDPIGLAGGVNTYGYAGANPIMYYDPNGENYAIAVPLIVLLLVFAVACAPGTPCANNLVDTITQLMAGRQRTPNPISHTREREILNGTPGPNCDEINQAIRDLNDTIKWRKGDLNPLEKGTANYVNHVKYIKKLRDRQDQLRRFAKEMGCDPC